MLRRTDELRAALLSSVSHDLRTPLAAIKASAESLLQHDVAWSDETVTASRLRSIARPTGSTGWCAICWTCRGSRAVRCDRSATGTTWPSWSARSPRGSGHCWPSTPLDARDSPMGLPPVSIDYLMIDQVVTQSARERRRATRRPARQIEMRLEQVADALRVCVADQGPGVPSEATAAAVREVSARQSPGRPPGSGLGLAVSRGFVEAHGGKLELLATDRGGYLLLHAPRESAEALVLSARQSTLDHERRQARSRPVR